MKKHKERNNSFVNDEAPTETPSFNWQVFILNAGIEDNRLVQDYADKLVSNDQDENSFGHLSDQKLCSIGIADETHRSKILSLINTCTDTSKERIGMYVVLHKLGEGTNHTVKLGVHRLTGLTVALKVLRKEHYYENPQQWWQNPTLHERVLAHHKTTEAPNLTVLVTFIFFSLQRMLQRLVNVKYAVKLLDALFDVSYKFPDGTSFTTHCLVLECALCSLFDLITRSGPLNTLLSRAFFRNLVLGLQSCHKKGVIHRDLKPEQILLSNRMELRLSDFNFGELCLQTSQPMNPGTASSSSKSVDETKEPPHKLGAVKRRRRAALVGTVQYMAPEVYRLWAMREKREKMSEEDLDYDLVAADVWGCGIILFFMLTAGDPFPTQKPARTDPRFCMLQDKEFEPFWESASLDWPFNDGCLSVDEDAKHLLHRLLDPNPKTRITLKQVQAHPWFAGDDDLSTVDIYKNSRSRYESEALARKEKPHSSLEDRLSHPPTICIRPSTFSEISTSQRSSLPIMSVRRGSSFISRSKHESGWFGMAQIASGLAVAFVIFKRMSPSQ